MRKIVIEVNGDATVTVDGTLLGSTPPQLPSSDVGETSLRHDTPREVAIAAAAHEANRQYCRTMGDLSIDLWSASAGEMQAGMIEAVRNVEAALVTTPEEQHERWMASRKDAGWVYGPQKSFANKTHPNLVPFAQLSVEQQRKDRLFFAIATTLLGH